MSKKTRISSFILSTLLLLSLFCYASSNNVANGLSCQSMSLKQEFSETSVVFSGHVVSKEYSANTSEIDKNLHMAVITFKVIEAFKGVNNDNVTLTSAEGLYPFFTKGQDYVVFAQKGQDGLSVDVGCEREHVLWASGAYLVNQIKSLINKQILSPLLQTKDGVPEIDLVCTDDLVVMQKKSDSSLVCVTEQTEKKLIERGWGIHGRY